MVHRSQHGCGHTARDVDGDPRCGRGNLNLGGDFLIPIIDAIDDFLTSDVN